MEISKMFMAHIVVFLEIYCTCNSIKVINIHRRYVEYINEVSEWRRVWKCRLKKKTKEEKKRAWCKVWIKNMQTKNSDLNGIEFEVVLSNVNNLN
jgi:hypothetical protein